MSTIQDSDRELDTELDRKLGGQCFPKKEALEDDRQEPFDGNTFNSSHMYITSSEMIFVELINHLEMSGLEPIQIKYILSQMNIAGKYAGSDAWFCDKGVEWTASTQYVKMPTHDVGSHIRLRQTHVSELIDGERSMHTVMELIYHAKEGYTSLHLYPVLISPTPWCRDELQQDWMLSKGIKWYGTESTKSWIASNPPPYHSF